MMSLSENDSSQSMQYLQTSKSILGNNLPKFETLDAKIANSLKKLLADFRKKVSIEEKRDAE